MNKLVFRRGVLVISSILLEILLLAFADMMLWLSLLPIALLLPGKDEPVDPGKF